MMIYKFLVPKNLFLSSFFFLASSFISFRRRDLCNYYTHTHTQFCRSGSFIHLYPFICICVCVALSLIIAHTANGHNITRMFFSIARAAAPFFSCVSTTTTTYFRFMAHNFLRLFADCCQLPRCV